MSTVGRLWYLAGAGLLHVDDAGGVLLLQVVDEARAQVVALRHHLDRVSSTRHCQQHAVLRLSLPINHIDCVAEGGVALMSGNDH